MNFTLARNTIFDGSGGDNPTDEVRESAAVGDTIPFTRANLDDSHVQIGVDYAPYNIFPNNEPYTNTLGLTSAEYLSSSLQFLVLTNLDVSTQREYAFYNVIRPLVDFEATYNGSTVTIENVRYKALPGGADYYNPDEPLVGGFVKGPDGSTGWQFQYRLSTGPDAVGEWTDFDRTSPPELGVIAEEVVIEVRSIEKTGGFFATKWYKFKPPTTEQIGAVWHTDRALYTAVNLGTALSIRRKANQIEDFAQLATIPDARNAVLFQKRNGQKRTGTFELVAQQISTKQWKLWRSTDGAQTWTMAGSPFQSPNIDHLSAVPLANGGAAIGIIKGNGPQGNRLVFKLTANTSDWPPDDDAILVRANVANNAIALLLQGEGKQTFSITGTDPALGWLISQKGGESGSWL